MRERKFRGKRVDNGDWAYGYYCLTRWASRPFPGSPEDEFRKKCVLVNHDREWFAAIQEADNPMSIVQVDPTTVGEYTGMKDKDGTEVYEGDIVLANCTPTCKDKRSLKLHKCEVRWSNMGMPGWALAILDHEPGAKWATGYLHIGSNGDALEVIASIHDTPSLLQGGEE